MNRHALAPGGQKAARMMKGPSAKWTTNYHEGDTSSPSPRSYGPVASAAYREQFVTPLTPNNTMIVALSCTTGGLLLLIILMLFFVQKKK